ncbi:4a-hydroxytetrahydrobiopterin dehydratase [Bradyrhizobium sp. 186]|uniref:4a-hydroxytetrahydrobiopterin dehydratase n=1 Tax=Bradyrhizobium sp. 186 TaxID=2782654 RepID=UPI003211B207
MWQPCFRAHQQRSNSQRRAAHRIERTVRFDSFREALGVIQKVGELAETEGHHPDISFGWGYATVSLNTKKIKGLHENDFIMASKIDRLLDRPDGFLDHKQ